MVELPLSCHPYCTLVVAQLQIPHKSLQAWVERDGDKNGGMAIRVERRGWREDVGRER